MVYNIAEIKYTSFYSVGSYAKKAYVMYTGQSYRGGESRAANSDRGLVLGVGGLGKPNRGRDRGETDSGSDRDSDETFQI